MGIELLTKWFPIVTIILGGAIAFGEMKADISSLQEQQTAQYEQIMKRLDRIEDRINVRP